MRWASEIATAMRLEDALEEAAESVLAKLGQQPDLVIAFVSQAYADHFSSLPESLREHFPDALSFGSSVGGVIGSHAELEAQNGIVLMAAVLPVEMRLIGNNAFFTCTTICVMQGIRFYLVRTKVLLRVILIYVIYNRVLRRPRFLRLKSLATVKNRMYCNQEQKLGVCLCPMMLLNISSVEPRAIPVRCLRYLIHLTPYH